MFYKYVKILNFILNINSCVEFREKICNINFSIKIQNLKIETKYLLINNDYNRVKSSANEKYSLIVKRCRRNNNRNLLREHERQTENGLILLGMIILESKKKLKQF